MDNFLSHWHKTRQHNTHGHFSALCFNFYVLLCKFWPNIWQKHKREIWFDSWFHTFQPIIALSQRSRREEDLSSWWIRSRERRHDGDLIWSSKVRPSAGLLQLVHVFWSLHLLLPECHQLRTKYCPHEPMVSISHLKCGIFCSIINTISYYPPIYCKNKKDIFLLSFLVHPHLNTCIYQLTYSSTSFNIEPLISDL